MSKHYFHDPKIRAFKEERRKKTIYCKRYKTNTFVFTCFVFLQTRKRWLVFCQSMAAPIVLPDVYSESVKASSFKGGRRHCHTGKRNSSHREYPHKGVERQDGRNGWTAFWKQSPRPNTDGVLWLGDSALHHYPCEGLLDGCTVLKGATMHRGCGDQEETRRSHAPVSMVLCGARLSGRLVYHQRSVTSWIWGVQCVGVKRGYPV